MRETPIERHESHLAGRIVNFYFLFFQLEEQKIELEGTKARLRMVNSRTSPGAPPAAITSVRVRSIGIQTDDQQKRPSSSQTDPLVDDQQMARRAPCRVVDASPKPRTKVPDNWATAGSPEETDYNSAERPGSSVERRSYSSRIPTPIKPVKSSSALSASATNSPASKRELPDLPTAPQRLKRSSDVTAAVQRTSPRPFQQQQQQAKVAGAVQATTATASRPAKTSFWAAWWRTSKDQT